jgi:glycine cleavage system H lipoate-binding protein/ABC-type phosphate transport system substrate-binding protein
MKTLILCLLFSLLLSSSNPQDYNQSDFTEILSGSTRIYCSPDLLDITREWVDEFTLFNPKVDITIIPVTDNSLDWVINKSGSMCIVSASYIKPTIEGHPWNMLIGRDVLVPIVNKRNPYIDLLLDEGISTEEVKQLITQPEKRYWNSIIHNGSQLPVNYYAINEGSSNILLSDFINVNDAFAEGILVDDEKALVAAVKDDPMGIGFCSYKNTLKPNGHNMFDNIILLPIDKNGNGKIDYIEQIYNDQDELMRGAWIGKYPISLVNSIYTIAIKKPSAEVDLTFLKWLITDGQQQLHMSGYGELTLNERMTKLNLLEIPKIDLSSSDLQYAFSNRILVLLFTSAVALLLGFLFIRRYRLKKYAEISANSVPDYAFDAKNLKAPGGIFFGKSHTWAFMEKNGMVKMGVDDFLQHITGPITAIKLKSQGEKVSKGDPVLSIVQNGKQINLYSPISGMIEKQNTALNSNPSIINNSPFEEGWVYMIKPANWLWDVQSLLLGKSYRDWLASEFFRFKDFLAVVVKPQNLVYEQILLQDGGEIKDNILAFLGPEAWEDFQINFIDASR